MAFLWHGAHKGIHFHGRAGHLWLQGLLLKPCKFSVDQVLQMVIHGVAISCRLPVGHFPSIPGIPCFGVCVCTIHYGRRGDLCVELAFPQGGKAGMGPLADGLFLCQ